MNSVVLAPTSRQLRGPSVTSLCRHTFSIQGKRLPAIRRHFAAVCARHTRTGRGA